jgi:hypothetical protein
MKAFSLAAAALLCLSGLPSNCVEQPKTDANLLENPGFESELTNSWVVTLEGGATGTWERVSTVQRSGSYSLKLSKTNGQGYIHLKSIRPLIAEPGKEYTFRIYSYSTDAPVNTYFIPRVAGSEIGNTVANPHSALWVDRDYDSQSFVRNAPNAAPEYWNRHVYYYRNTTDKPQEVYVHAWMYGNPCDLFVDDVSFSEGHPRGTSKPQSPGYRYTEAEVMDILAHRSEETGRVFGTSGTTHFQLNGKDAWPIFYRGLSRWRGSENSIQDPGGFGDAGVEITNSGVIPLSAYWTGPNTYDWPRFREMLMDNLRKNPHSKLLLELSVGVYRDWAKTHPDEIWQKQDGGKMHDTSYASPAWRTEGGDAIRHLVRDLKANGFWKIVVGVNMMGGHDGQFWTKVIGEYAADYSPANLNAWHKWLRGKYGSIESLNGAWKTQYGNFNEAPIPPPASNHEVYAPILPLGPVPDYREYSMAIALDLRESLARAFKEEAGKDIFVSAYGMPMENQHEAYLKMAGKNGKAQDLIASMSYYPYRLSGLPSGYLPEQGFGYHNVGFMQELDLRSFAAEQGEDEIDLSWLGSEPTIERWRNMHRKLVGVSLAQNQGFWYYDMEKQYVDPAVLKEVGAVKKIADKLVDRKGVAFRPDVCLVRFGQESRFYGSGVDSAVGATGYWMYMQLQSSGVPFDIHYLSDIMAEPGLQRYKVYVFHNNTYLTAAERDWISEHLKSGGRTIVWLYDTGYVTEQGLSTDALSRLVGMNVKTEPRYDRATVKVGGEDALVGGAPAYWKVPPFQGMAEALCSVFSTSGACFGTVAPYFWQHNYTVAPGVSRYQRFWLEDSSSQSLGKYIEDGRVAMAVKRFATWTSVYIGAPNAWSGEMLNNIAKQAGAYRYGVPAMGEVHMSGRFISYHALRNGEYLFQLPPGASRVIDPESGEVLATNSSSFTIHGKAQSTYWFFIE